ncbi:hypothetical protein B0H11DRAFT_2278437 [Mycena galericulata]|nr:hypothetical protein B0H11DRAFT_2278437 [Mycena galericulata]
MMNITLFHHRAGLPVRRESSSLRRLNSKLRDRPQKNVLAVANNVILANDKTFLPMHAQDSYITLTFVNITNIRPLRHQFRLCRRCRAQLHLCVCDRYGAK